VLQREVEPTPSQKTDATAAFLASLEEPKLTSLAEAGKKPPIEILPPGMMSLNAPISIQKKPGSAAQNSQPQPGKPLALEAGKPLALEAPPTTAAAPDSSAQQPESTPASAPVPVSDPPQSDATPTPEAAPPESNSGEIPVDNGAPTPASVTVSDENTNVNGETVQEEPKSDPAPPEAPSPVAEVSETNTPNPTTVPASGDPFI
jgi:hypothetical protein